MKKTTLARSIRGLYLCAAALEDKYVHDDPDAHRYLTQAAKLVVMAARSLEVMHLKPKPPEKSCTTSSD